MCVCSRVCEYEHECVCGHLVWMWSVIMCVYEDVNGSMYICRSGCVSFCMSASVLYGLYK